MGYIIAAYGLAGLTLSGYAVWLHRRRRALEAALAGVRSPLTEAQAASEAPES